MYKNGQHVPLIGLKSESTVRNRRIVQTLSSSRLDSTLRPWSMKYVTTIPTKLHGIRRLYRYKSCGRDTNKMGAVSSGCRVFLLVALNQL